MFIILQVLNFPPPQCPHVQGEGGCLAKGGQAWIRGGRGLKTGAVRKSFMDEP